MNYESAKETALNTINSLFLDEMRKNFPANFFEKYQAVLLKMVQKEINPICINIIEKNNAKLINKFESIQQIEDIDEDEKQIRFNEELNSLFNMWGKAKMVQKAYLVQKNGINFIKYTEGQFSKNKKKKAKEENILEKLKKEYSI